MPRALSWFRTTRRPRRAPRRPPRPAAPRRHGLPRRRLSRPRRAWARTQAKARARARSPRQRHAGPNARAGGFASRSRRSCGPTWEATSNTSSQWGLLMTPQAHHGDGRGARLTRVGSGLTSPPHPRIQRPTRSGCSRPGSAPLFQKKLERRHDQSPRLDGRRDQSRHEAGERFGAGDANAVRARKPHTGLRRFGGAE